MNRIITTIAMAAILMATCAAAQKTSSAPQPAPFTVCFASGSETLDWTKEILEAKTVKEVEAAAKNHHCSVTVKGRIAYVVYEPSFAITDLERSLAMVSELSKAGINSFDAIDPAKVSEGTYKYLLDKVSGMPDFARFYEAGDVKVWVKPSVSASFSSGGKTISLDWRPHASDEKEASLTAKEPEPSATKKRVLPKSEEEITRSWIGLRQFTIQFSPRNLGPDDKADMAAEIMADVAARVKALKAALTEASTAFIARLMEPYQAEMWDGSLSDGANSVDFQSLSQNAQKALMDDVAMNYKAYGFSTEQEATTFLRNSSASNARYDLAVCTRLGIVSFASIVRLR